MVSIKGNSVFGIIIAIVVLAVLIWNVVYIDSVRRESATNTTLSKTAADVIFWVDIILIVLISLYLLYNIYVIFTSEHQRTKVISTITQPRTGAVY